jgi:hypothetical protein
MSLALNRERPRRFSSSASSRFFLRASMNGLLSRSDSIFGPGSPAFGSGFSVRFSSGGMVRSLSDFSGRLGRTKKASSSGSGISLSVLTPTTSPLVVRTLVCSRGRSAKVFTCSTQPGPAKRRRFFSSFATSLLARVSRVCHRFRRFSTSCRVNCMLPPLRFQTTRSGPSRPSRVY